jgi:hypothetical protein
MMGVGCSEEAVAVVQGVILLGSKVTGMKRSDRFQERRRRSTWQDLAGNWKRWRAGKSMGENRDDIQVSDLENEWMMELFPVNGQVCGGRWGDYFSY